MNLQFVKMHSLGNDFIMIDAVSRKVSLSPDIIIKLANRHKGVGFDQCILVESSNEKEVDFFYRIFNANGQEVGQCGNGARCLAKFIHYKGLSNKKKLRVKTTTTQMSLWVNEDESVTVEIEKPKLKPNDIPFLGHLNQSKCFLSVTESIDISANVNGNESGLIAQMHLINVGNPHAVLLVEDLASVPVSTLGKQISEHPFFPEQINVGFMQLINTHSIQLRVYERGCGETYACGSGAVAAAAVGHLFWNLNSQVTVNLPGGDLIVDWPDSSGPIYLKGPSTFVYEAVLNSDFI